jgi:lipopolysaccharide biosynthesis glycosyltransferase
VIELVFAADRSYFPFVAVAMESLYASAHHGSSIRVHLISPDLTPASRKAFRGIARRYGGSFGWYTLGDMRSRLGLDDLTPHFYRLFIPYLLPGLVDRYIYLDSDLIILDDLGPLFDVDLAGAVVAAAVDYLPTIADGIANYRTLGLAGDDPYLNSGVLVVDRHAWMKMDVGRRVVDITRANADHLDALGRFHQYDQYGLNVALHGRWRVIDRRWNYGAELPFDSRVAIVHFNGHGKPWSLTCTDEYQQHFRRVVRRLGPVLNSLHG